MKWDGKIMGLNLLLYRHEKIQSYVPLRGKLGKLVILQLNIVEIKYGKMNYLQEALKQSRSGMLCFGL